MPGSGLPPAPEPDPGTVDDRPRTRAMLERLTAAWPRRAYAKKQELRPFFEEGPEDYLEDLLPFREMPEYRDAPEDLRSRVLSCGWLMYNAKTVQIETEIVNPTCMDVVRGEMPGLDGGTAQLAVCEAMVDEVYHVHLVEQASRLTRRHRGLEDLRMPTFGLVQHMEQRRQEAAEPWEERMVRFATAVVSEIFISDYLRLLSETEEIQSFNRMTVAAHRHDETAHGPLFRALAELYAAGLTPAQRAVFADLLAEPVLWFADRELDVWRGLLRQIGFPHADRMIDGCRDLGTVDVGGLDYSGVVTLAQDIGLMDVAGERESFSRQGLLC